MRLFFPILIFTYLIAPIMGQAQLSLNFKIPLNYKELQAVAKAKKESGGNVALLLANADLNDDFINEYIVKPSNCQQQQLCDYKLIGFKAREPIILGEFDAHKIIILSKKDYGVKRLNVYNKSNNDFSFQTAVWDPVQYKYTYIP